MRPVAGWRSLTLSDVCEVGPRDPTLESTAPFVPMDSVQVGFRWPKYYEERGARGGVRAKDHDVLFARITPCLENGKLAQIPAGTGPVGGSTEFIVVRPGPDIDPAFLYYWCLEPSVRSDAQHLMAGVTGRMRLSGMQLASFPILVPPLRDQRRIVDILEDHLSRLDTADASLAAAARRLISYEAALLAECYTSAAHVPLGSVTQIQGGIQKQPKRAPRENSYPFLRVANVTAKGLDLTEIHKIELFEGELARLALVAGDLLVVEGNGSPSQIGRAAMWDGSISDCVHQNHLIRVRPLADITPVFLEAVWNAPQNRAVLTRVASSSSGLHTLSVAKLKSLTVPMPDPQTQMAMSDRISDHRTARRRLDADVLAAKQRGRTLRGALLHAAFSGQLTGCSSDEDMIEAVASV